MSISSQPQYESIDNLYLDPMNPRLGMHRTAPNTGQEELLEMMRSFKIDELAWSYVESGGFWVHEPLITVRENLYGKDRKVVVEGNRRLAALKFLHRTWSWEDVPARWEEMSEYKTTAPENLFERVPHLQAESRRDAGTFLGFLHVTGIKPWDRYQKAGFIAKLIDEDELTYQETARRIGHQTPSVRMMYISYKVLMQLREHVEEFDDTRAANRFAILNMSIKTSGVQDYLGIDVQADPENAKQPVSTERLENLQHFYRWIFGTKRSRHIVRDTRLVDDFSTILKSKAAIDFLERTAEPNLEMAYRMAGGEEQAIELIDVASQNVEIVLARAHEMRDSCDLKEASRRLGGDVMQLLDHFPDVKKEIFEKLLEQDRTFLKRLLDNFFSAEA